MGVRPLEILFRFLLLGDAFEGHAYLILSVLFKVEESIRVLQLVKVPLNVLVVIYVLHELCSPLSALLIIHELFAVQIVKQYSDLRLVLVSEIKPKLLNLD